MINSNHSSALKDRWAKMTSQERIQQVAAAHEARRGRKDPITRMIARANTRYQRLIGVGPLEIEFAKLLNTAGIQYSQQVPLGKYNLDFTICENLIAVEICSGAGNNRISKNRFERIKSILNQRHLLEIRFHTGAPKYFTPNVINQVITFIDFARLNPTSPSKYRVIRPNGERYPIRLYGHGRPIILAPDYLIEASIWSKE